MEGVPALVNPPRPKQPRLLLVIFVPSDKFINTPNEVGTNRNNFLYSLN